MNKEELLYHLRYEERPTGMVLLHERAKQLNVHPVSMHLRVNRVWHEYAGIKGIIAAELQQLTEDELREALSREHRSRVCQWIGDELNRRHPPTTLGEYFSYKDNLSGSAAERSTIDVRLTHFSHSDGVKKGELFNEKL